MGDSRRANPVYTSDDRTSHQHLWLLGHPVISPELLAWLAACTNDSRAFVLGAFPWGEPGQLASYSGPEAWQWDVLGDIDAGLLTPNEAIQLATASGHGIGKSALVSWIILWAFSTAPDTRGVITANTETQLKTKTWAELGKWFNLFIARDHFYLTATALLSKDPARERTWRIDQIPWSEKNPQAFAGLHNKGRRLLLIFDEASEIADIIWETAEGALTDSDTEILWLVFGNPTRSTGRFRDCFDSTRHGKYWKSRQIDARTVNGTITNRTLHNRWIEAYGIDSDFCRIRILGQFPRMGEMEFISAADVDAAMEREVHVFDTDPLALGVDVARYGANESVLWFRKGRDARTIIPQSFRGINTVELAAKVSQAFFTYHVDGIFIDGGGVGGGVVDNVRNMQLFCFDVQFGGLDDVGGDSTGNPGEAYANKRAAMWGALRAWLKIGAIPYDPDLRAQLLAPKYALNNKGKIQLETKEDMMRRGVASPDKADALALTFAYPLAPKDPSVRTKSVAEFEYNPFDQDRMAA